MSKLNFQQATDAQLKNIAFEDDEASWLEKVAAEAELIRRSRIVIL